MRIAWIAALIAALGLGGAVEASAGTVAVPNFSGSRKTGASDAAKVVRKVLRDGGHKVLGPGTLKKAGRKARAKPDSAQAAARAGAGVLVTGRVSKKGRYYVLSVIALDVETGREVGSFEQKYRGKRGASKAGAGVARQIVDALESGGAPPPATAAAEEEDEEEEEEEAPRGRAVAVAPVTEAPDPLDTPAPAATPAATPSPSVVPKDEEDEAPAAAPTKRADASKPDTDRGRALLIIEADIGSQAGTAYTVAVGDVPTALAYDLGPLLMIGGQVRLQIPKTGLGIELGLAFAPVQYALDTQPAVDPASPTGSFLDLGGSVSYALPLSRFGEANALVLEPLAGLQYQKLTVQEQSPFTIVVGSSAVVPHLGTRLRLELGDSVELGVDLRLRLIASYAESPVVTGESSSGLGLFVGGSGRYWLLPSLGVSGFIGYEYTQVGFTGQGDRPTFQSDPTLVDATVFASNLRLGLGVAFRL